MSPRSVRRGAGVLKKLMSDFKVAAVSGAASDGLKRPRDSRVLVIGVGGGGGNSVQYMMDKGIKHVDFVIVNTDSGALNASTVPRKVQIGVHLTRGLGAGTNPAVGRKAAEESREDLKKLMQGYDMIFITAGMGGGTGTGAAPLIAELAKSECNALTVAVVTRPFNFEGKPRQLNAQTGISHLARNVDALTIVDNNKLLRNLGQNITTINAFNAANNVLYQAVQSVTDIIYKPGFINVDFNDIKTTMLNRGMAIIGTGYGRGPSFVEEAIHQVVHNPLIEQVDINSASGLLVHFRINPNFPVSKINDIGQKILSYASDQADSKYGLAFDEKLAEDEIAVTIIISGITSAESMVDSLASGRPGSARPFGGTQAGGFFAMAQHAAQAQAAPHAAAQPPQPAVPAQPAAPVEEMPISYGGSIQMDQPLVRDVQPRPQPQPAPAAQPQQQPAQAPAADQAQAAPAGNDRIWNIPSILRNRAD